MLEKSGRAKTGVVTIARFNSSKAASAFGVHPKFPFLSKFVNGVAIRP
jgi:hypothetical protein